MLNRLVILKRSIQIRDYGVLRTSLWEFVGRWSIETSTSADACGVAEICKDPIEVVVRIVLTKPRAIILRSFTPFAGGHFGIDNLPKEFLRFLGEGCDERQTEMHPSGFCPQTISQCVNQAANR